MTADVADGVAGRATFVECEKAAWQPFPRAVTDCPGQARMQGGNSIEGGASR